MISSVIFWQFVVLNFINVLVNTARSLVTIKGGKWLASLSNAICYGYYTIIIVITATYDIPLVYKCVAVAIVNFVGVFTIKFCEEKMQKEKEWIFLATAKARKNNIEVPQIYKYLKDMNIKCVYVPVVENELYTLEVFSKNKKDSDIITALFNKYNIKYSAIERQA